MPACETGSGHARRTPCAGSPSSLGRLEPAGRRCTFAYARAHGHDPGGPRPACAQPWRAGRATWPPSRAPRAGPRGQGADLVVFPELGLTGYQLQDLAAEVALRLDDPRLADLAAATEGLSADRLVRRGVGRSSAVHRRRAARGRRDPARPPQAVPADLRAVRRAPLLRRRATCSGPCRRAWASVSESAICEDFWHLTVPQILALDGAQILINVSSSPGRDLAATNEVGLGTATSWRTLMRTYAQLTTSFVVFCNRVGVDESISFWGGSEVIAPTGAALLSAPMYDEGLFSVDIAPADVRRERIGAAAAARRATGAAACASSPGSSPSGRAWRIDSTSEPGARARAGRGARRRDRHIPIGFRAGGEGDDEPGRLRAASGARDRHGHRAAGHRGVHPRPARARRASSAPSSACPAASIRRWSPTSRPRRSARTSCCACSCRIGRRHRRRARTPRRSSAALGCRVGARRHHPDGRRLLRARTPMRPTCGAGISWPACG